MQAVDHDDREEHAANAAETEWNSVRALAALAGATEAEIASMECIDVRDYGAGLVTCRARESRELCPICWAMVAHDSTV